MARRGSALCFLLFLFAFLSDNLPAADALRQRGNTQRNGLSIAIHPEKTGATAETHRLTPIEEEAQSSLASRRIRLSVSGERFPMFRVARLAPIDTSTSSSTTTSSSTNFSLTTSSLTTTGSEASQPFSSSLAEEKRRKRRRKQVVGIDEVPAHVQQFRLGMLMLYEFIESPAGRMGLDATDQIVQSFPLWHAHSPVTRPVVLESDVADDINYHVVRMVIPFAIKTTQETTAVEPHIVLTAAISDLRGYVSAANRTLSPNSWKFDVLIVGFPWTSGNASRSSRLAIKMALDTPTPPVLHANVPPGFRDDPDVESDELVFPTSELAERPEDRSDSGYFAWEIASELTKKSCIINSTNASSLPKWSLTPCVEHGSVVVSKLLTRTEDFLNISDDFHKLLEDPLFGRVPGEMRHFFYVTFSGDLAHPDQLLWDPYVGIDEDDDVMSQEEVSGAIATSHMVPHIVVTYLFFRCCWLY